MRLPDRGGIELGKNGSFFLGLEGLPTPSLAHASAAPRKPTQPRSTLATQHHGPWGSSQVIPPIMDTFIQGQLCVGHTWKIKTMTKIAATISRVFVRGRSVAKVVDRSVPGPEALSVRGQGSCALDEEGSGSERDQGQGQAWGGGLSSKPAPPLPTPPGSPR